ncbi:MAG: NUDIX hydrolase [Victivallaceae bacterium]|nr:NUDIX hydrolase [Victivallaceae bacterium]
MNKTAIVTGKAAIAAGKFLGLNKIEFIDERGRARVWEAADRPETNGAAVIIGHLMPSNRVLLTRQFRPPTGKYVVEFPAGLIEPGEPPEETAKRELMEETGFAGLLSFSSPPAYSSAGMSGESSVFAIIEINDFDYQAGMPENRQEDSENIEVFAVKIGELAGFLKRRIADGDGVDSKLLIFAMAQEFFHV